MPNAAHEVLVRWQSSGRLKGVITQNVDRLHQKAGHQPVIDLHGRLDQVVCTQCNLTVSRGRSAVVVRSPQSQAGFGAF